MGEYSHEKEVDQVQELFAFLQGTVPEGYRIPAEKVPHLTPDQAWTVVWFVQEMHIQLTDEVERCESCGDLFHSACEGVCREDGPPYHLCDGCQYD